jgi:hypothetical protein
LWSAWPEAVRATHRTAKREPLWDAALATAVTKLRHRSIEALLPATELADSLVILFTEPSADPSYSTMSYAVV